MNQDLSPVAALSVDLTNKDKMAPSITETEPVAPISLKQNSEAAAPETPAPRHEEYQNLDLIREILENGEHRPDRYTDFST